MDDHITQRKLDLLSAQPPYMQPPADYLECAAKRTGKDFPLFDPEDSGAQAELLLLLSYVKGDPMRENGSPFISTEEVVRNLSVRLVEVRFVSDRVSEQFGADRHVAGTDPHR